MAVELVAVASRVILGTHYQTPTLLRSSVDRLDDIDQLLLVLQHPVELIVVAGTKIAHHMFITEEEHDSHRVVELVHLLEVWDLVEIADVDDGKVLDAVGDSWSKVSFSLIFLEFISYIR